MSVPAVKHERLSGRLLMLGFGSVGQAVLPLLLRHLALQPEQILILAADSTGSGIAREFGVPFRQQAVTEAHCFPPLAPIHI